jgi:hypothetical protein
VHGESLQASARRTHPKSRVSNSMGALELNNGG